MPNGPQSSQPDAATEKRRVLNYIGHMALELARMADKADAEDIGRDLRALSDKTMTEVQVRSSEPLNGDW